MLELFPWVPKRHQCYSISEWQNDQQTYIQQKLLFCQPETALYGQNVSQIVYNSAMNNLSYIVAASVIDLQSKRSYVI